jgi:hypothetical protein
VVEEQTIGPAAAAAADRNHELDAKKDLLAGACPA